MMYIEDVKDEMYQLCPEVMGQQVCIKRVSDGAFIPFDPNNGEYQKYLNWLAEGNTPLPVDA